MAPPFRFVRLNATMYPASELEQSLYAKFGVEPEYVEEEDPQELIRRSIRLRRRRRRLNRLARSRGRLTGPLSPDLSPRQRHR